MAGFAVLVNMKCKRSFERDLLSFPAICVRAQFVFTIRNLARVAVHPNFDLV